MEELCLKYTSRVTYKKKKKILFLSSFSGWVMEACATLEKGAGRERVKKVSCPTRLPHKTALTEEKEEEEEGALGGSKKTFDPLDLSAALPHFLSYFGEGRPLTDT